MRVSLSFSLLPNRCSYAVYAKFIIQIAIVRSCFCVFCFHKISINYIYKASRGSDISWKCFDSRVFLQATRHFNNCDFHFIQISNCWCFNSFPNGSARCFNIKTCIKFYYGIWNIDILMFIIKLKLKFMLIYAFALCHRKLCATATLPRGGR